MDLNLNDKILLCEKLHKTDNKLTYFMICPFILYYCKHGCLPRKFSLHKTTLLGESRDLQN